MENSLRANPLDIRAQYETHSMFGAGTRIDWPRKE